MSCFGVPYAVTNVDEVRDEDSFSFQKICDSDGVDIMSVKLALDLAHTGVVSRLHNVKTVDIVVYT